MRSPVVGLVIDKFLTHVRDTWSEKTLKWYQCFLGDFRVFAGEQRLTDLRPSQLDKWIARRYPTRKKRAPAKAVGRLCRWAMEEGLIDRNPLAGHRMEAETHRERVLTGAEYAALVTNSKEPLRAAIKFLWHTGARPQEVRAIRAAWLGDRKITFPTPESKGRRDRPRKRRVIYLDSMAAGITARLAKQYPAGPLFRSPRGNPWTADSLKAAVVRVCERAEIQGVCVYTLRHTWITRKLESGVPVATVAALAGNSPATILRVYCHVAENEEHLRENLEKRRAV